jgi:hypothetical protein
MIEVKKTTRVIGLLLNAFASFLFELGKRCC